MPIPMRYAKGSRRFEWFLSDKRDLQHETTIRKMNELGTLKERMAFRENSEKSTKYRRFIQRTCTGDGALVPPAAVSRILTFEEE